jgi:hypothetical protein
MGNNKITELRTIFQRESQNSYVYKQTKSVNNRKTVKIVMTPTWYWRFQRNDFWKMVIYSDEYKVELGMDNRVLIWRQSGKEWTPPCLNPGRGCRVSLVIWV